MAKIYSDTVQQLRKLAITDFDTGCTEIQAALDAAEKRGVDKGREEKRAEVLAPIERWVSSPGAKTCKCMATALDKHNQDCPWEAMRCIYLTLLQPPPPAVPPVPEWFKEWRHSDCDGTLSEQWAVYRKHVPKVDAGELLDAVIRALNKDGAWGFSEKSLAAAIRAVLERGK